MNDLEKKIFDKLVESMDVDVSELEGFDENSPIFAGDSDGRVSMNLDSIDSLELSLLLESEWGIQGVDEIEVRKLTTVRAIAEYITKHRGSNA